jgi:hypothetical protein
MPRGSPHCAGTWDPTTRTGKMSTQSWQGNLELLARVQEGLGVRDKRRKQNLQKEMTETLLPKALPPRCRHLLLCHGAAQTPLSTLVSSPSRSLASHMRHSRDLANTGWAISI